MAVGNFGTKKLADITFDDIDILYSFSPSREDIGDTEMRPLFQSISSLDFKKMIGADGVYKLRLPANVFKNLGFYSILIKPKTFETTIVDCSYIVTNDNNAIQFSKRGIVIPTLQFLQTSSLVGYQIEYFDSNNNKIKNTHRIITSSDLVSVSSNNNIVSQGAVTYVLDPGGSNIFLTVTPDEASLISRNQNLNIGIRNQRILISNTYFDPVFVEIEMVEHTLDTLAIALYGNSTRDLGTGELSYFTKEGNIYRQYNLYSQKIGFPIAEFDIREEKTIINSNQTFNGLINP